MQSAVFSLFILASIAAQSGYALHCYTCNSTSEPDCMDPKKLDRFKSECQTYLPQSVAKPFDNVNSKLSQLGSNTSLRMNAPFYYEIACTTISFRVTSTKEKFLWRGCGPDREYSQDACQNFTESMKKEKGVDDIFCSQCKTEFCNSSTNITPTVFTVLITFISLAYYNY